MIKIKIKIWLLAFLLTIVQAGAQIQILNYQFSDSNEDILTKMNSTIISVEELGHDSTRFSDIMQEALTNNDDFMNIAAVFRKTTILADTAVKEYNKLNQELDYLYELQLIDETYINKMDNAFQLIIESKYESAQNIFQEIKLETVNVSRYLFEDAKQKIIFITDRFELLDESSALLVQLKIDFTNAETNNDLVLLKSVLNDIDNINNSINKLLEIQTFINHFESKNIHTDILTDVFDESIFHLNRKRYSELDALHDDAQELYNRALLVQKQYITLRDKIDKLPKSDKPLFNNDIEALYNAYLNSNFDEADYFIKKLNNGLIDFESKKIATENVSVIKIPLQLWIKQRLGIIIGIILIVVILTTIYANQIQQFIKYKTNKQYEVEKKNLINLMKKLQQQYFIEKSIPKKTYEAKLSTYQKKLVDITKKLWIQGKNK